MDNKKQDSRKILNVMRFKYSGLGAVIDVLVDQVNAV